MVFLLDILLNSWTGMGLTTLCFPASTIRRNQFHHHDHTRQPVPGFRPHRSVFDAQADEEHRELLLSIFGSDRLLHLLSGHSLLENR